MTSACFARFARAIYHFDTLCPPDDDNNNFIHPSIRKKCMNKVVVVRGDKEMYQNDKSYVRSTTVTRY